VERSAASRPLLGLDFVRVELDMRMYHPQRDVFTWDNEEMQTLELDQGIPSAPWMRDWIKKHGDEKLNR
jgi:hypothetical protein